MKKLILVSDNDSVDFALKKDLCRKVAKVKIRTKKGTLIGGGVLIGTRIVCPVSLFGDLRNPLIEYDTEHGIVETWGDVIELNPSFGFALLRAGYIPSNQGVLVSDPDPHQVVQVVDHSVKGWSTRRVRLAGVTSNFIENPVITDPQMHPGYIGGVLFDRDGDCVGMVTGKSTKNNSNLYGSGGSLICNYINDLDERGVICLR